MTLQRRGVLGGGLLALLAAAACQEASSEAAQSREFPWPGGGEVRFVNASDRLTTPPSETRGVSLVDYDDDGNADITAADLNAGVTLYRGVNAGAFTLDRSRLPNSEALAPASGAVWADVDDDGALDLLVTHGHGQERAPTLLMADGDHLTDRTAELGVAVVGRWESAAFVDLDGDGPLDLVLVGGLQEIGGAPAHNGTPNAFLRGVGDGHFVPFEALDCPGPPDGEGWGALAADLNGDGRVDYLIGNDKRSPTVCLSASGHYADHEALLKAGRSVMGMAVGDVDGDGCPDLYGTLTGRDMILSLVADGTLANTYEDAFEDRPDPSVQASGYGVSFLDVDSDGDQDVVWVSAYENANDGVIMGHLELIWNGGPDAPGKLGGVGSLPGQAFSRPLHGYGLATGDADGDGSPDLLLGLSTTFNKFPVATLGAGPLLLLNRSPRQHDLWVELSQPAPNRRAVGATVTVSVGGRKTLRVVTAGESFQSSAPYRLHFGLGAATAPEWVMVQWPNGQRETFTGVGDHMDALGVLRLAPAGIPCSPAGTCDDIAALTCRAAPPPSGLSLSDCEAICARLEECGWTANPSLTVSDLCNAACRGGEVRPSAGACVLTAACGDVPKCGRDPSKPQQ